MLNIVVPMAGAGSRFAQAGYLNPKPLIDVLGQPMISWVIGNITPKKMHRFIFICQNAHIDKYGLQELLQELSPGSLIVGIDGLTDGAARTVLAAANLIDSDEPLVIANSDQYVDFDIDSFLDFGLSSGLDGAILTMKSLDPKWSYAELDSFGMVQRVREKEVVSNEATVGIYLFSRGADFIASAYDMIRSNDRVNGEFYVAPTYNEMVKSGKKIGVSNIGSDEVQMNGLGTPEDLMAFIAKRSV